VPADGPAEWAGRGEPGSHAAIADLEIFVRLRPYRGGPVAIVGLGPYHLLCEI
jgi:hypothetical protein